MAWEHLAEAYEAERLIALYGDRLIVYWSARLASFTLENLVFRLRSRVRVVSVQIYPATVQMAVQFFAQADPQKLN